MQLDWESLVKRYVYNAAKTPYFTAAARLTRAQARSELFVYMLFLVVLMGVICRTAARSVCRSMPSRS
jgi:hypothetical protein